MDTVRQARETAETLRREIAGPFLNHDPLHPAMQAVLTGPHGLLWGYERMKTAETRRAERQPQTPEEIELIAAQIRTCEFLFEPEYCRQEDKIRLHIVKVRVAQRTMAIFHRASASLADYLRTKEGAWERYQLPGAPTDPAARKFLCRLAGRTGPEDGYEKLEEGYQGLSQRFSRYGKAADAFCPPWQPGPHGSLTGGPAWLNEENYLSADLIEELTAEKQLLERRLAQDEANLEIYAEARDNYLEAARDRIEEIDFADPVRDTLNFRADLLELCFESGGLVQTNFLLAGDYEETELPPCAGGAP